MSRRKVLLGEVGVDSGQLVICDPAYLENEFKRAGSDEDETSNHDIYRHKKTGKLWQFTYNGMTKPSRPDVHPFTGTYADVIPEYGKSPNELRESGEFEKTDIDPMAHIPDGEFSYRGISKMTLQSKDQGGQLNYKLGHAGAGVCVRSGYGDGSYKVYAEIEDNYVRRVIIELD